ncbi:MAG TPA: hypothetical protein VH307_05250 [Streptosporangiaceae bacterium]|jgi:hypothetical protein|nr:hypothetical protein [Streptosporangiaceae bacterium]
MLRALTLLFRAGGAVVIGVATFGYSAASGRDLLIEAVAFAIGAVAVAYWLAADLRPEHRQPRVLAGALIVAAAASGFASTGGCAPTPPGWTSNSPPWSIRTAAGITPASASASADSRGRCRPRRPLP